MTKEEFFSKWEREPLYEEWCTGGQSGGSCWGDEPSEIEPDDEPTHGTLNRILSEELPGMTDKEYWIIFSEPGIFDYKSWTDYEYYGNYYERSTKTLNLEVLWPFIELATMISDPEIRLAHYTLIE